MSKTIFAVAAKRHCTAARSINPSQSANEPRSALVYLRRLEYLAPMRARSSLLRSSWCKWLFRLALVSFVGLYSIGLLPHKHAASIPDELNCPVCHAVNGLTKLTGNSNPPGLAVTAFVLLVLLVLAWAPMVLPRAAKILSHQRARAPPFP
jgi:hypothetical protein